MEDGGDYCNLELNTEIRIHGEVVLLMVEVGL
jgi:hypothetical protein